jgi:hypothetical protein
MNNRSVEMHLYVGKERTGNNLCKGIAHACSFVVDLDYIGEK